MESTLLYKKECLSFIRLLTYQDYKDVKRSRQRLLLTKIGPE